MLKAELIENEIRALKTEMFGPAGYAGWVFAGTDKEWNEMTEDEKYNYFNDFEDLPEGISFDMGVLRGLAIAHDLILSDNT
jgi:hypothetical protein